MENNVIAPLRSRVELDEIITTAIALGTITSVEDAIDNGDIDAIEYGATSLSDDLRRKVSIRKNLTPNVISHLVKDRNDKIKWKVITNYWDTINEQEKQKFTREGIISINAYNTQESPAKEIINVYDKFTFILANILSGKNNNQDEYLSNVLKGTWTSELYDAPAWIDPIYLRAYPKLNKTLNELMGDKLNLKFKIVSIDPNVRLESIKTVMKYKTTDISYTFRDIINYTRQEVRDGGININFINTSMRKKFTSKQYLWLFCAQDKDKFIRRKLINMISDRDILNYIAENDTDPINKSTAKLKYMHYTRRAAYAVKYHARKRKEKEER